MKIGIEGQILVKENKTGIPWTLHNMLNSFRGDSNSYVINYFGLGLSREEKKRMRAYAGENISTKCCSFFHNGIYRRIWERVYFPYSFFFGKKNDVTLFFNYLVPTGVHGKIVNLVCDMGYKACPELLRENTRKELEQYCADSCNRADLILTISEFSKQEIIKYLNIDENKIKVIPLGVDRKRYRKIDNVDCIEAVKEKYGVSGDYYLYVGTIEPRKNLERLIRAYSKLCQLRENVPSLVLAGGNGWKNQAIYDSVKELKLTNKVIFTGFVGDDDVPAMMCGAKLFVFPSVYEGFGLPPLEAMACEIPTLVANAASLPEVVGEASILVNPYDIDDILKGLLNFYDKKIDTRNMIQEGLRRLDIYTWDAAAERTSEYIEELIDK